MRIALITPGFSASEQDWCIPALLTLVRELARSHDVEVFTLRYPPRRATYAVYGATVHAFGGGLARGVGRPPLLALALLHVLRQHRLRSFDVIHGLWADEPGYVATMAGRLLGIPAVVSLMGGELVGFHDISYGAQLSRSGRYLIQWSLHHAARVTGGSIYVCDLARHLVDPARLTVLPLGVDGALFSPQRTAKDSPLTEGGIKLLHVASLVPVKDQATLIRAVAAVVRACPAAHLHIVGQGPLRDELLGLARTEGIATHLTLHGEVSHARLPAYYRAADLCVLSSRFESQSMVALEAAACGRATISTRVGILPQLYTEAWTVPVGDRAALSATILAALSNADCMAEIERVGLRTVRQRYLLEHTTSDIQMLYRNLVGRTRS